MASRAESWLRLRAERWQRKNTFKQALSRANAKFQSVEQGAGNYVYDEYSVLIASMPSSLTAEAFLSKMLRDLNGTVKNATFDRINVFKRTRSGGPKVGEIIHIDILRPDNGSVALADHGSNYFIFQTVETPKYGTHPEYGAREFGFERLSGNVGFRTPRHSAVATNPTKFYTRGVSRPSSVIVGWAGEIPQSTGWISLMRGIANAIRQRGGNPIDGTIKKLRRERSH